MNNSSLALVVSQITYKDWKLHLFFDTKCVGRPYIKWEFTAICSKTKEPCVQSGRNWYLSQHMTESEIVFTALKAAITAEEHECRENFKYEDKPIANPHISVRALLSICEQEDVRS